MGEDNNICLCPCSITLTLEGYTKKLVTLAVKREVELDGEWTLCFVKIWRIKPCDVWPVILLLGPWRSSWFWVWGRKSTGWGRGVLLEKPQQENRNCLKRSSIGRIWGNLSIRNIIDYNPLNITVHSITFHSDTQRDKGMWQMIKLEVCQLTK